MRECHVEFTFVTFPGTKTVTFRVGHRACRLVLDKWATPKGMGVGGKRLTLDIKLQMPGLVIIFEAQVRNQILTAQMAQGVLQLHQLDENVVFRIKTRSSHR